MKQVLFITDDLFVKGKVRAVPYDNLKINFIKSEKDIDSLLTEFKGSDSISKIVIDLSTNKISGLELGKYARDCMTNSIPEICYFSHVDIESKKMALKSGFNNVIPRSVFFAEIKEILEA